MVWIIALLKKGHTTIPPIFLRQVDAAGKRWREKVKSFGHRICEQDLASNRIWDLFCSRETALLEGLEKYQPEAVGVKVNKPLSRFPFRNKFISDYIFSVTGKRRTPKQVGSRLQQLRDTSKDENSWRFRPSLDLLLIINPIGSTEPSKPSREFWTDELLRFFCPVTITGPNFWTKPTIGYRTTTQRSFRPSRPYQPLPEFPAYRPSPVSLPTQQPTYHNPGCRPPFAFITGQANHVFHTGLCAIFISECTIPQIEVLHLSK